MSKLVSAVLTLPRQGAVFDWTATTDQGGTESGTSYPMDWVAVFTAGATSSVLKVEGNGKRLVLELGYGAGPMQLPQGMMAEARPAPRRRRGRGRRRPPVARPTRPGRSPRRRRSAE